MITPDKLVELYCPVLMSERDARALFSKFDKSKNNLLDYIELQSLNAYIFKMFPRLGDSAKPNELLNLPVTPVSLVSFYSLLLFYLLTKAFWALF